MNQSLPGLEEQQGRLFEVGFNIGILAYFRREQIGQSWLDFYLQDLEQLKFQRILDRLVECSGVTSTTNKKIITQWSELTLLRGFLGGLNFIREYIQSLDWKRVTSITVVYYQCSFINENSINTHNKPDYEILPQFANLVKNLPKESLNNYIELYQKKGEFLQADTLIWLQYEGKYRLLVVDMSNFSVDATQGSADLEFVELIKRQLIQEINYLKSRSIFSRLQIDTGETEDLGYAFATGVKHYFAAFSEQNKNKESVKLIQAGSYAYSFYQFLLRQGMISAETELIINAIGYSNRGISALNVTQQNIELIKNCYEIYRHPSPKQEFKEARNKVFDLIKRQVDKSFDQGKQFVDSLLAVRDKSQQVITHQETLTDFANTAGTIDLELAQNLNLSPDLSLRDAHAKLITRALESQETYLFLTGNPGIGKTTAIVEFLNEHLDEGFLFLYISPRIQVNLDIIEKFKDKDKLRDRRLFCLTTNSHVLKDHGNFQYQNVVSYLAEAYPEEFTKKSVKFVKLEETKDTYFDHYSSIDRHTEDTLRIKKQPSRTVLGSISSAIYTLIEGEISNQIVATVSLQALKKTRNGDTLKNLETIFQGAYNSSRNEVIPQCMQEISRRIKHVFIMIDEITGSESGVEFLHGLKSFCHKYQLSDPRHGFNTKIIVADASIVDSKVIEQHLSNRTPEPDKIFFRKATSNPPALTQDTFTFLKQSARVINANSYPAQSLKISYKVLLDAKEFDPKSDRLKEDKNNLASNLERTILSDLDSLWEQPGQILLYIQNKQKLQTLLEKLEKQLGKTLERNEDYLEIKSNLSEQDKLDVHKYKSNPNLKLILMTSSGSRGLSFPYVKHILVDIPGFQVEQNLMEILQVIYRGRGDENIDKETKQLIFYLAQKVIYYPDSDLLELARQEAILNILNTLLLVKLSMLTRIKGSGNLGDQKLLIIPIGGKAITSTGVDFSNKLNNLLELLAQEHRLNPEKVILKSTREKLENILDRAKFSLGKTKQDLDYDSYLSRLPTFHEQFSLAINQGLDQLLDFGKLERSYLAGSLIIVPTENKRLSTNYLLSLIEILKTNSKELLTALYGIKNSLEYHNNLRYATGEAIDLIKEIDQETERSLQLVENSQYPDQYYAFPLFTLLNLPLLQEYLAQELAADDNFKNILECYINCLYPAYNLLPIGSKYEDFPFILFRSYSLEQRRQQVFSKQYLFNSSELNIVNLILSH
ncbi:ATP-binding protein [Gloeocapsa sp. PCC 73106]|uniref:ATP-binding protein n=1 Tax=Gloeocapsa sp. PCC 73106 TaxID=102232 RepID=UPI0002AD01F8|nr:ATP-binding protein [Gloeocapsa sp. PCC 73106]ELR97889.1 ATPase [Gloeocapsa sp. PCC 73106]